MTVFQVKQSVQHKVVGRGRRRRPGRSLRTFALTDCTSSTITCGVFVTVTALLALMLYLISLIRQTLNP